MTCLSWVTALGVHAQTPIPVLQINAGGGAVSPFAADADFAGGFTGSWADTFNVTAPGAAPNAVYQTFRGGNGFTYTLPGLTHGGAYTLRLHFAEPWYGYPGRGGSPGTGQRLMNITVNGAQVLTNFDVYQQAGAADKALVKSLPATADVNGKIMVTFAVAAGSPSPTAFVNGLEVLGVPPAAPTGLAATAGSTQVGLTWNAVTGATGYNVYRAAVSGGPYTKLTSGPVTGTTYTDPTVAAGTVVYYVVTALTPGGESGPSNQAATPPAAPTGLTVNGAYGQNTLSWTASPGAVSYTILRGTSPGGETLLVSGITSAPYVDRGLTNGVTYYYTVQANSGGSGGGGGGSSGSSGSSGEGGATPNPSGSPGYFLPAYWGGSVAAMVTGQAVDYVTPFSSSHQLYSASAGMTIVGPGDTGSGTVSGPITTTFTYQPSGATDMPPSSVIVEEDSSAGWSTNGIASGSCDDGIGQSSPTMTGEGGGRNSVVTVSGTKYTLVSVSGSSFTVSASPAANVTAVVAAAGCQVAYDVKVLPPPNLAIQLGGTTPDPDGTDQDILVGQGCSASITGLTLAAGYTATYLWKVSGTTFQSWSPTTPANPQANPPVPANPNASSESDGPGPLTNPTAHWYWNDASNATETIDCTVTITPPSGQGAPYPIVAHTRKVNVMVPFFSATGTGGFMQIKAQGTANNYSVLLDAQPSNLFTGGMTWEILVITPPSPAFGNGKVELVQIVTPNESYVNYSTRANVPDPENNRKGLDNGYPYGATAINPNGGVVATEPDELKTQDSPQLLLQNNSSPVAYSTQMTHSFQDTLMYEPPGSTQFVPLAKFTWSTNGSATIPGTNDWTKYVSPIGQSQLAWAGPITPNTGTEFTPTNAFPNWTVINVFPTF